MPEHPSSSRWHTPGICNRKTIFGRPACKFRPRYDREDLPFSETSDDRHTLNGLDKQKVTYIRDVCVRCGKTVERKDAA